MLASTTGSCLTGKFTELAMKHFSWASRCSPAALATMFRRGHGYPWPEHDLDEVAAAVGGLGHGAVSLIGVPGDHDAGGRAGVQVGKHVALGERGSEQLLGIPPARVAPEGRVGTARDGLRQAGVPGPVPVPAPLTVTS